MEAYDGEKSSRFPCLNAARYVMTVLIVLISLNTAKLVLYDRSHDPLNLWVAKGFVYVRSMAATITDPPAFMFYLAVRVSSDRGFKYYATITAACLFTSSLLDDEGANITICFDDPDPVPGRIIKAVEQRAGHYFLMDAKRTQDSMKHPLRYLDEPQYNINRSIVVDAVEV